MRLIVKIDAKVLTTRKGLLAERQLERLVEQVAALVKKRQEVILVSSEAESIIGFICRK